MGERSIGQVASGPVLSVADEMEWGRQYREQLTAPDMTLTQRIAGTEMLPMPAKALGVILLRAADAAVQAISSIREGM